MNKIKRNILLLGLVSSFGLLGASSLPLNAEPTSSEPRFANKLPSTIDLNDSTESEIRSYYSSLGSLSASERNGTNLLKNLKPILQDFDYYSYDNVWKIYEITDSDSFKSETTGAALQIKAETISMEPLWPSTS